jgi:hypothetical protein
MRLPEHHVVRPHFACRHRLVARAQGSRADDPFRFQALDRLDKIFPIARDMDAICAKSGRQPCLVFNQQRTVGVPGGTKQGRHDRFRMGLGAGREADERASCRRRLKRLGENLAKGVGVGGRQQGSDEIERAARRVLRGQRHERQSGAGTEMSPTIAAKSRSTQGFRNGSPPECLRMRSGPSERLLAGYGENAARRRSTCEATADCALTGSRECATTRL